MKYENYVPDNIEASKSYDTRDEQLDEFLTNATRDSENTETTFVSSRSTSANDERHDSVSSDTFLYTVEKIYVEQLRVMREQLITLRELWPRYVDDESIDGSEDNSSVSSNSVEFRNN